MMKRIIVLSYFLLIGCGNANAYAKRYHPPTPTPTPPPAKASAHVAWTASTSTGVTGYKLLWGTASRNYSNSLDCGKQLMVYLIGKFDHGVTYYFAVKAYNGSAISKPSVEATYRP